MKLPPFARLVWIFGSAVVLVGVARAQGGAPLITQQPFSQEISNHSTVVFSAAATSATGFQWQKNGVPITSASAARLVIFGATTADAGDYAVTATNAAGSTTSVAANLKIAVGNDFGRLSNLSILTELTATTTEFTLGTVIGGANTSGLKPLLIRAVGPSLAQFPGIVALADSKLDVIAGDVVVASNDDWAGVGSLNTVFQQVGAFSYLSNDSKDAAVFTSLSARNGGYTVRVSGAPSAQGSVLAEIYDATPTTAFPPPTPRLINVSVLKKIDAGTSLTAGFVVGGSTAKTVLVRAIGPGLGAFGVQGVMADPRMELFNRSSISVASNDNWGGDPQLTAAGTRVGAFALASSQSTDAMLLLTLTPSNYTVQVDGGTGGGMALVEIYEVP